MPSRILRDGIIESMAVHSLSWEAELFFRRLMSIVDDYGRYSAIPQLLASRCYPLQIDKVKAKHIEEWLKQCQNVGLITLYNSVNGKPTLEITNFDQRIRTKSKFPSNPDAKEQCITNDGQMTAVCVDEVEDEDDVKGGKKTKKAGKKKVHDLPDDWGPKTSHKQLALDEGVNLERAATLFRDWALGGGKQYADWNRTFSNALRTWLKEKAKGASDVPLDPLGKPLRNWD